MKSHEKIILGTQTFMLVLLVIEVVIQITLANYKLTFSYFNVLILQSLSLYLYYSNMKTRIRLDRMVEKAVEIIKKDEQ